MRLATLAVETPTLAQAHPLAGHKFGVEFGKEVLDQMQAEKDRVKAQQKL